MESVKKNKIAICGWVLTMASVTSVAVGASLDDESGARYPMIVIGGSILIGMTCAIYLLFLNIIFSLARADADQPLLSIPTRSQAVQPLLSLLSLLSSPTARILLSLLSFLSLLSSPDRADADQPPLSLPSLLCLLSLLASPARALLSSPARADADQPSSPTRSQAVQPSSSQIFTSSSQTFTSDQGESGLRRRTTRGG